MHSAGARNPKPSRAASSRRRHWCAPSLTSDKEAGLGDWSLKDTAGLLKTGVSARGAVYGPMAEVIYNSQQYLTDADIQAMAVYLKSSAQGSPPAPVTSNVSSAEGSPCRRSARPTTTISARFVMAPLMRKGPAGRRAPVS